MCKGPRRSGRRVDLACVCISPPRADWLNQGRVSPYTKVDPGSPDADICIVCALIQLREDYRAHFARKVPRRLAPYGRPSLLPSLGRRRRGGVLALVPFRCVL